MGELITAKHMKTVLALLRLRFDYILVDTNTSLQDVILTTFDQADQIILVATPDIPSIKDTRLFFEVIEQLDFNSEHTMLVLNRADRHAGITATDVENTLKHSVDVTIPADTRTVMFSINQGIPFVSREPTKPVSIAILELAKRLREALEEKEVVELAAEPVGRSRLSRLFSTR
jgi:pilus assembly protein CpaE